MILIILCWLLYDYCNCRNGVSNSLWNRNPEIPQIFKYLVRHQLYLNIPGFMHSFITICCIRIAVNWAGPYLFSDTFSYRVVGDTIYSSISQYINTAGISLFHHSLSPCVPLNPHVSICSIPNSALHRGIHWQTWPIDEIPPDNWEFYKLIHEYFII